MPREICEPIGSPGEQKSGKSWYIKNDLMKIDEKKVKI